MAESEKKGFNIDAFAKPIGQFDLSVGTTYLYQPNETVRKLFREMADEQPEHRAKTALSFITSLEVRKRLMEKIKPIPTEIFAALTEKDFASLAELFRQRIYQLRALPESPLPVIEPQMAGESALCFFDRILDADIKATDEQSKEQYKRLMESVNPSASKLLEQLNLSSERLGGTVREFDRLKTTIVETPPFHDHLGDFNRRMARERSEDRKIAQLTGEMTKQSAEMLQELVGAAGKFMVRFDERDQKSDGQIRIQLWVAIGSLILSVLLSGIGVWFAAKSYYQDGAKNTAEDKDAQDRMDRDARIERLLERQIQFLEATQAERLRFDRKVEIKPISSPKK